jgi:uncharacterized membrane protein (Fun14 family)
MWKRLTQFVAKIFQPRGERHEGRSPLSAKSVLIAGGLFAGALGVSTVGAGTGTDASWLRSLAPPTLVVTGSYLAGFFIGWGTRRAIKLTTMITGIAVAATGLLIWLGWDISAVQSWLNSAFVWAGEHIEGAGHDLVSFLPYVGAAGAGGVLGFKRK